MRARSHVVALAAALLVAASASTARAEDEVDATSLAAEKAAEEAFARAGQGAYREAIELYLRADSLAPSAVLAFDVAWLYDVHLAAPGLALPHYRRAVASPDVTPELAARAQQRITALEAARHDAATAGGAGSQGAAGAAGAPGGADADAGSGSPSGASPWSPLRTWALVAGGAGVVAVAIGTAFAIVANDKNRAADRYCSGDRCSDGRALTLTDEATSAATRADVAIVTGAILVAGGVTLWLLAPRRGAVDVGVRTSGGAPAIVLGGAWP